MHKTNDLLLDRRTILYVVNNHNQTQAKSRLNNSYNIVADPVFGGKCGSQTYFHYFASIFHQTFNKYQYILITFIVTDTTCNHRLFLTQNTILKQNNLSLVICVVISLRLRWRKDHLSPQGECDPSATPNKVKLPYSTPDEDCFVFISYCLMVLSHSKLRYIR